MSSTRLAPEKLGKTFSDNVDTVDARLNSFLDSSDPSNAKSLRRATKRFRTSYSLLPRRVRRRRPVRRYMDGALELAKAMGKLRDIDTIAEWASQIDDARDRRSFVSDLERLRTASLHGALKEAKNLAKMKAPSIDVEDLGPSQISRRLQKVERRLVRKVDKEFEEFLSTQEIEVMHSLRKDSKRLRHLIELSQNGHAPALAGRLRSIQDDLGGIRDDDLVIDYLRGRVRLTSTRSLLREMIARRHGRLEDFVSKNRGQGRVVPVLDKKEIE
jgi:CHAD domain-containing protein